MLKLSCNGLESGSAWREAEIALPTFNIEEMRKRTHSRPTWVHFGGGNIFRGFIAPLQQELLNAGEVDTGIVTVSTYDTEIIDRIYCPFDNLSLLVRMHSDGELEKSVVASVAEALVGDPSRTADWGRIEQIFSEPSLQLISFTVTEKAYKLADMIGDILPEVKDDIAEGPEQPRHFISKVVSLAYRRFLSGRHPIAFVSMDNCSQNGDVLKQAMLTMAQAWADRKLVSDNFIVYLKDPNIVSFPWTMIDKITPRPSEYVKNELTALGVENMDLIRTSKNTYLAPFVNAEVPQYLVVEDDFPNGRPPLEKFGVLFADRKTVEQSERMKVTTCLNPLHTALAVFGCLLGYHSISDEMNNPILRTFVEKLGYDEGLPVVADAGLLDSKAFMTEVINERLPNPYIPDSPQRIATDTSQKLAIRFGETIKAYCSRLDFDVMHLKFIPLVLAGWCRYLLGVSDSGESFDLSPDPMLDELREHLKDVIVGQPESCANHLRPILSNDHLFGVHLYDIGLGLKIEDYFRELISGPGAVRTTLEKYVMQVG